MNREEFIYYLNHPAILGKKSILEMHELLNEFPYFQTAHLLLLKNLYNLENIKFSNQLKISAAHITNREILYYLLQKEELAEAETIEVAKEKEERLKKTMATSESRISRAEEYLPDSKERTSVDNTDIQAKSIRERKELQEERIMLNEDEEIISAGIQAESSGEISDKTGSTDETSLQTGILPSDDLLDLELKGDDDTEVMGTEKPLHDEERKEPEKPVILSKAELIDRFIETDPKIVPEKESWLDQEDISEESIENEGFMTDTLAKIYIRQGYYSKAIFAYEELSLKFPEKSSYFASQIERIKKLINDKSH